MEIGCGSRLGANPMSGGGMISGDLVITGDLTVQQDLEVTLTTVVSGSVSINEESANAELILSCYHDTEATTSIIRLRKADNTLAAPALVDDNAVLGTISFEGHDGSGWHEGARIEARIQGTPSDGTDMPTELTFWTVPEASATAIQAVTIDNAQNVGIGVTPRSWYSTNHAIDCGGIAAISFLAAESVDASFTLSNNAVFDQADVRWEYVAAASGAASRYTQASGTHQFLTAVGGTAGNLISWTTAMTIANDGDVTGGTAGSWALQNVAASGTVPAVCPNSGDVTSGIGASSIYPVRFITTSLSTLLLATNSFDLTTNKHCNLWNTRTYTDTHAAGTNAYASYMTVGTPTFASTEAITITDAASVMILNPPIGGTNTTITNPWALWVDAGNCRFDGGVYSGFTAPSWKLLGETATATNPVICPGGAVAYGIGGTATTTTLIANSANQFEVNGTGVGFFATAPQAQQAHIADADGQLADITTKFNTLLADLEGYGLLAAA